ncbi:MAG: TolC family protein [Bacteroidota bacterium]
MKNKLYIFVALILSATLQANAQTNWTLEDCINHALKNNISVQQSQAQLSTATNNLLQSKLSLLPSVNASASNNYNFGRSIDPFTNTFAVQQIRSNNFSISGNVTLFSGLQNQNTIKQNDATLKAAKQDLEATRNTVALNIAAAFLQVVLNEEIVEVSRTQMQTTQQQLDRAQKLVDAGRQPINTVLDLKAQLSSENLTLVNAQNQLELSYLNLWQLMMYQPAAGDKVVKPTITQDFENLPVYSPQTIYENFSQTAPEIRAAQYRVNSSLYAHKVALGGRSPRISLSGSISSVYSESFKSYGGYTTIGTRELYTDLNGNPVIAPYTIPTSASVTSFGQQLNDNLGKFVGFSMSIPIFNGWQVNNSISNAKNSIQIADLNKKQAENTVYRDVTTAVTQYEAAKAKYTSSKENIEAQQKSYEFANARNEAGLMNFAEFALIKNNLARAETNMVQAKYELLFRIKTIEFYNTGKITNQ